MAELNGPRLEPSAGGAARQLVVFLHGYGADGNDLIDIGRTCDVRPSESRVGGPLVPLSNAQAYGFSCTQPLGPRPALASSQA